ncbi:hypothetical protein HZS_7503 [Henneguya salminicola]|nr:hypothetical protein HZS_7503 [Henneguya salminicola]
MFSNRMIKTYTSLKNTFNIYTKILGVENILLFFTVNVSLLAIIFETFVKAISIGFVDPLFPIYIFLIHLAGWTELYFIIGHFYYSSQFLFVGILHLVLILMTFLLKFFSEDIHFKSFISFVSFLFSFLINNVKKI